LDNCSNCKICKQSKPKKDYAIGEFKGMPEICHKCLLEMQLKKMGKKRLCKACEQQLPAYRWAYCSDECLKKSKYSTPHWTRSLAYGNENWKERFIYSWKKK